MRNLLFGAAAMVGLAVGLQAFAELDPRGFGQLEGAAHNLTDRWSEEACAALPSACTAHLVKAYDRDLVQLRAKRAKLEQAAHELRSRFSEAIEHNGGAITRLEPTPELVRWVEQMRTTRANLDQTIARLEAERAALPLRLAHLEARDIIERLEGRGLLMRVLEESERVSSTAMNALDELALLIGIDTGSSANEAWHGLLAAPSAEGDGQ